LFIPHNRFIYQFDEHLLINRFKKFPETQTICVTTLKKFPEKDTITHYAFLENPDRLIYSTYSYTYILNLENESVHQIPRFSLDLEGSILPNNQLLLHSLGFEDGFGNLTWTVYNLDMQECHREMDLKISCSHPVRIPIIL